MKTREAISLISKIRENVNRLFAFKMQEHGIDGIVTSHGDIIYSLFDKQKMTMAEIAEKIDRDKSTVTALIDKLVRLGYVSKDRDTEDTRVVYVTLTAKGRGLKPEFEDISTEVLKVFFENVSENEKAELLRILLKIYNNF